MHGKMWGGLSIGRRRCTQRVSCQVHKARQQLLIA